MKRTIPFLKYRYFAYLASLTLLVVFFLGTVPRGGLNMGIDFVGGTKIIVKFNKEVKEKNIREVLKAKFPNASIQQIDADEENQFIIATKLSKKDKKSDESLEKLQKTIQTAFPKSKRLSVEAVGPAIGDFLRKSALKLSIIAIVMMMIYLAFRFELKFAIGAMAALIHDLILALLFCGVLGLEINIPIIAALLTIFGYSVNDTIVIFDRIRENIEGKTASTFHDLINKGITQSISRTLLTSITTLLAVLSLYILGGDVINNFALVLLFGVLVGTYSSIYVASPVVHTWDRLFKK